MGEKFQLASVFADRGADRRTNCDPRLVESEALLEEDRFEMLARSNMVPRAGAAS
jgi:hypothetical protein